MKVEFELDQHEVVAHYLRKLLGSNVSDLDINQLCKHAVFYAVGDGAKIEGEELDGAAKNFANVVSRLASLTPHAPGPPAAAVHDSDGLRVVHGKKHSSQFTAGR